MEQESHECFSLCFSGARQRLHHSPGYLQCSCFIYKKIVSLITLKHTLLNLNRKRLMSITNGSLPCSLKEQLCKFAPNATCVLSILYAHTAVYHWSDTGTHLHVHYWHSEGYNLFMNKFYVRKSRATQKHISSPSEPGGFIGKSCNLSRGRLLDSPQKMGINAAKEVKLLFRPGR